MSSSLFPPSFWRLVVQAGSACAWLWTGVAPAQVASDQGVAQLYQQHCAVCHGVQRTGGMGPALLPESLERIRTPELERVITHGRTATQMEGFSQQLSGAEIKAMTAWIRTPVQPAPQWTAADMRASRTYFPAPASQQDRPVWSADPMNLFIVVEAGDHHVSLVDGDTFKVITRFPSRYALHGGPKFTSDGRYVFFGSRDGWITKYDLWQLRVVAEVRAGLNMRNVAVSDDGKYVMAANYFPHTVELFDADLQWLKTYQARTEQDGSSRVSAVYDAAPRQSFIVALKDIPEIWEIPYGQADAGSATQASTTQQQRTMDSALRHLSVLRTRLSEPLDDFFFDQSYRHVLGATRARGKDVSASSAQVVDLDLRRKISDLPLNGMPHLGSGITFAWNGTTVLASPNLGTGAVDVIDMKDWKSVRTIAMPGPGFFMRSHEDTPFAWTDSMMCPTARDTLTIVDKRTLAVAARVREPGKTLAHIEFTRNGSHALASLMEMEGALIVYDARTFDEVTRLPMSKPIGKYNVWNKITRSEGTSH